MLLRLGFFLAFITTALAAKAQGDSVLLKPVTVYGLPDEKYLAGSQFYTLDSALQKQQDSRHLGEILAFQFPVYFRNYGNGMLSGISLRGTSPSHTAVRWNGININSFSLGQADFSILPTVAFSDVKVHAGGGSARYGSGAFGGTVLLSSVGGSSDILSVSQEVGSYGRYFTSLKGAFRIRKFSSTSSLYRVQAQNDFPIPHLNERQPHAAYWQQGIVEHAQYTISNARRITLDYWYNDAHKEIQPNLGSNNNTDEQDDRNHRFVLSYEQNTAQGFSKITGGFVDDRIVFNNNLTEIVRWIGSASHQFVVAESWHVSGSAEWNHIIGKIKEYGPTSPVEDRVDLAASVQKDFKNVAWSFNLRQPFITHVSAPLLPYIGADVVLFKNAKQTWTLSANASKNFRAPTLNDRYWQDAGARDLLPETSYAAEAGLTWRRQNFNVNTRGFYQWVDQWIQWVPGAQGVYRPRNVKQVRTDGVEAGIEDRVKIGPVVLQGKVAYQFTQAITEKTDNTDIASVGKQLIYTPVHTGSGTFGVLYGTWSLNMFLQYSGTRFTDAANAAMYALDPFLLADMSLNKSYAHGQHGFDFSVQLKNVFATDYQLYSGRAMPGRNINFKISYHLTRKQQ
ncbi:TonB-dependent receptor [Chryseolinea lacunae]|uniref:TonB-dependent receptor n=1 Tax=Chryseolinea lacunae TaxID=2801331 RepID=A0ABS1KVL5_9BACT|nr:TonB-dependent receptor [Chryseolinea lacunae]MBL0742356.1 TonB-dependent receptor [Chryseolinea lacunae]